MNISEYSKLYVLKNQDTDKIIYKYKYEKGKLVYSQKGHAQNALNGMLKWHPNLNVTIEEITI